MLMNQIDCFIVSTLVRQTRLGRRQSARREIQISLGLVREWCRFRGHLMWLTRKVGWKDVPMPNAYPREFRLDVVQVARNREPGVALEKIAHDSEVHPITLST